MKTVIYSIIVLGVLGGLFGAALAYASKVFHVEVDEKQVAVRECLAGANCGGCGYPGCDGYAAAVASGNAPTNLCVAGGSVAAVKIAGIMGVTPDEKDRMVAFVPCSGGAGHAAVRFNYSGPKDCRSAMLFGGQSSKLCTYSCMGLGNCVRECSFDAIHIVGGVAQVNRHKCVGCGSCAAICPKGVIEMIPASQRTIVTCRNHDKGAQVMKECDMGCIGCSKCARECPQGAIVIEDNLARINPELCSGCGHCVEICPRHIIKSLSKA